MPALGRWPLDGAGPNGSGTTPTPTTDSPAAGRGSGSAERGAPREAGTGTRDAPVASGPQTSPLGTGSLCLAGAGLLDCAPGRADAFGRDKGESGVVSGRGPPCGGQGAAVGSLGREGRWGSNGGWGGPLFDFRTQGRVSFISCALMVELPARGSLNDSLPSAKEEAAWMGVGGAWEPAQSRRPRSPSRQWNSRLSVG